MPKDQEVAHHQHLIASSGLQKVNDVRRRLNWGQRARLPSSGWKFKTSALGQGRKSKPLFVCWSSRGYNVQMR